MKKTSIYRQHTKERRALAIQAFSDEHRQELLAIAQSWDTLALERENVIAKNDTNFAVLASPRSGRNGSGINGSGVAPPY